jgi:hypothetical protein
MRLKMLEINQSLFMSEAMENAELLIPFDEMKIGGKLKQYIKGY